MKPVTLCITAALCLPLPAIASDYTLTFSIPQGVTAGTTTYNLIDLDVSLGANYITANGVIASGVIQVPATGTCFASFGGGIFCNLQIDQLSANITLTSTLEGTIVIKDANGFISSARELTLTNIQ